ncbi:type I toxin-antitoxin system SymE family toxin [Pectobacterium parmentieri]|uniref:Type I toxin-antitoxin system SymE family toxin n=1 Tax=Pectobacterium parmentieri TaxID=1905730 RepID=A0ABS0S6B9_PECPM|nr:SymE family type I addiction module toxin [Pectobacterium parmentieri]AYH07698.1 type I toxin-antitoxin system SymE family toxin [Pectobacterium parmentieri]AYH16450.1 type I toxin-antitoxin system SymE family toxin [Pectobacterium parmentieri]AYH25151.1 type I toxin-antitoxin system SymE family toxin [Pectobacterium parmentieri]MBI0473367.1 type I toxin-antitoxin system SymE family toxin [Pectobacterium parmentieri]MBI0496000.1 type I toxin-antitoxin system SymE family toxin [Pectobacteriu
MHCPRSAGLPDVYIVNKATKTERYYTVGYAPHNGKSNPPSAINLKGRWLEESGFILVTVTVERGRIIIETQINL